LVNDEKFTRDLELFTKKITESLNAHQSALISKLKDKLISLHEKGLVKINHSVMELLCAKFLVAAGYNVELEKPLDSKLICDVYGVKGDGRLIVEVETGFVPPSHALDPATYSIARIASKIARYSVFADKFALGVPPYHLFHFPKLFFKPPRKRSLKEIKQVKELCDLYYKNPPIEVEEFRSARLHTIYIIDVDRGVVREVDPDAYWGIVQNWSYEFL